MKLGILAFWATFILVLFGCETPRPKVDVSGSEVNLPLKRFDRDLFDIPSDKVQEQAPELKKSYGTFFKLYVERILELGLVNDPVTHFNLSAFVADPDVKQVAFDVQKAYPDFEDVHHELNDAFSQYNHYFSGNVIPDLVTMVSGFNYGITPMDSTIGIGLDFYLGHKYKYYGALQIPQYRIRKMNKENIAVDVVRGWMETEFLLDESQKTVLAHLIHNGKIMYLTDICMPEHPDSLLIGYSAGQYHWCEDNEFSIWAHFVDNKLFYSTDYNEVLKYTGEGPFTSGLSQDSPAQIGTWLGWQIVSSYMSEHPEVTPSQLMGMNDPQVILNQSGYKPSK